MEPGGSELARATKRLCGVGRSPSMTETSWKTDAYSSTDMSLEVRGLRRLWVYQMMLQIDRGLDEEKMCCRLPWHAVEIVADQIYDHQILRSFLWRRE